MKAILIYAIILLSVGFTSCNVMLGDKNLGEGYKYWNDQHFPSIVFNNKNHSEGVGLEVIPPIVIDYDWNDNFIVIKSRDINYSQNNYWIIDKRKKINLDNCYDQKSCDSLLRSNVTGPLNIVEFRNLLTEVSHVSVIPI